VRLARFSVDGNSHYGVVDGEKVERLAKSFLDGIEKTGETFPLSAVKLLPPVEPSKIICIGLNFQEHAAEMGQNTQAEPLLFFKPPSALIGSGEQIVLPHQSNQIELEVELAMVVGKKAKNVTKLNAKDYVLGFTVANDVTARDVQFSDLQWARSKAFDTFGPLGPWIETDFDPKNKGLISRVNGQVRQRGNTSMMVSTPYDLLAYVSENLTLFPGDVILTGSPAGISSFTSGDLVECEIEGIGLLSNPVA
jgi:2-keto-4-pentenoate hydratase/2-oxohepta-3-ene-1,7-dioic acid hydratase in catechol pathway